MIKLFKEDKFLKGVTYLTFGFLIANCLNYFYNFFTARYLGPKDYGTLIALTSILSVVGVPTSSILLVSTKFTAKYKTDHLKLSKFCSYLAKNVFLLSFFIFVFFLISAGKLIRFLNLEDPMAYFLILFVIFPIFLVPLNQGIFQGKGLFKSIAKIDIFGASLKLGLTMIFIPIFSLKLKGAILAFLLSSIFVLFLYGFLNRDLIFLRKPFLEIDKISIFRFGKTSFFYSLFLILLSNLDILLAKHFLSDLEAGLYGALSLLAKIIFFLTGSISNVLLPTVIEKIENNNLCNSLLIKALIINFILGGGAILLYLLFPKTIILILFGKKYLKISSFLFIYGLTFLFLALINVFGTYFLSISKFGFILFLFGGVSFQIILFMNFHQNISQFVLVQTLIFALLLIGMIFYFLFLNKFNQTIKKF